MIPQDYNNIPDDLKNLNQWVCVYSTSKVPMQSTGRAAASTSDPSTWSGYNEAAAAVVNGIYDNLGFVFNDNGLIGIDIDKGFDSDGLMSAICCDIIHVCASYTEQSRSCRGVHIIIRGNLPFPGRNNGQGVEMYKTGRYFIMTGRRMIYGDISDNQSAVDYILTKYFADMQGPHPNPVGQRQYNPVFSPPEANKVYLRPSYPELSPGTRNTALFSYAGSLLHTGYTPDDIYTELKHVNETACSPPLTDAELRRIVKGIQKYKKPK